MSDFYLRAEISLEEENDGAGEYVINLDSYVDRDGNSVEVDDVYTIEASHVAPADRTRFIEADEGEELSIMIGIDWFQENDLV